MNTIKTLEGYQTVRQYAQTVNLMPQTIYLQLRDFKSGKKEKLDFDAIEIAGVMFIKNTVNQ